MLWTTVWQFLTSLNIDLPYGTVFPFQGTCPRAVKTYVHSKSCTQMFTATFFIIVKKWKQPKCLATNEWVNKMRYIHIIELYSAIKINAVLIHATTRMSLENIMLSKRGQSQNTTYCMIQLYKVSRIGTYGQKVG